MTFIYQKQVIFLLAIVSLISGLFSAFYWYRASKVIVSPAWKPKIRGDSEKNIMSWVAGNMAALTTSGKWNARAAVLAAIAVASGAIANCLSLICI
jgi:hypothetical protein